MKKRLTAFVLILAVAAFMVLPINCAAADEYPDLASHWAREYMLDLAERGYLTGYEDSTMRPNNLITSCEALALLSRLYSPDDEAAAMVLDDYSAYLDEVVPESHAWVYDELAVCLAAGLVSEAELEALTLSAPIEKELFCVFVARAAGLTLTDDAPEDISLNFRDSAAITLGYLPYVLAMTENGIVTGNEKGEFEPASNVTRAVAATVVSRALTLIGDTPLELEGYSDCEKVLGFVTDVSASSAAVRLLDGIECEYALGDGCGVDGRFTGRFASLNINGSTVLRGSVIDGEWISGVISSMRSTGKMYITVIPDGEKKSRDYYVEKSSILNVNGEDVEITKLKTNSRIALCASEGVIDTLYCSTEDRSFSGRIAALTYGATVDFRVIDGDGTTWILPLNMSKLPAFTLGDMEITIDRLNVGDEVEVEISRGEVISVATSAASNTVSGELTSVITDSRGTTWVITKSNKDTCELLLAYNVKITRDGKNISSTAVTIGDSVTATIYGDTVTLIEVGSSDAPAAVSKLCGTVLAVDSTKKIITVLDDGKLYYVNAFSATAVIDAPTGKSVRVASIEAESCIVAYGTYESAANLKAITVVIE